MQAGLAEQAAALPLLLRIQRTVLQHVRRPVLGQMRDGMVRARKLLQREKMIVLMLNFVSLMSVLLALPLSPGHISASLCEPPGSQSPSVTTTASPIPLLDSQLTEIQPKGSWPGTTT